MKKAAKRAKKSVSPNPVGAPTKKTQVMLDAICAGISVGKSARAMCLEVGISQPCLWGWLGKDELFVKQYARAKEQCADFIAAECIEISDDGRRDYTAVDGEYVVDHDHIQRSRLRVDARKWYASKLAPKKYGDRLDTTLSAPDGGPVQVERIERVIVDAGKK